MYIDLDVKNYLDISSVASILRRLSQEDFKLEANCGYITNPVSKRNNIKAKPQIAPGLSCLMSPVLTPEVASAV